MGQLLQRGLWAGSRAAPAALTVPSQGTAVSWGCHPSCFAHTEFAMAPNPQCDCSSNCCGCWGEEAAQRTQ